MAGRRTTLAAVLLLGLCASAMAGSPGSRKLQAAAARQPWDASKSADSINSGFAAVFNAAKDIELQARMKTTPANLYSAAGRTLLQRESPKTEDSTFKMNDASSNIIKMQQRLSGLAAGRGGRVLLQGESFKTSDSTFKMNDASSNIIKMQQRLSSLAARGGRVLLQRESPKTEDSTFKMNDASSNIIKMQQRLSGLAAGRGGRVLLQRESPKTEDSTFKMNDASSNIIKMQQRLSGLAAGRGGRVLLQGESFKTSDSTFKMNDASSNIIKMQQRLSSLAARGGRVLLQSGRSTSDRMTQNTIKINAAADLVHQATTRMMSKVKSRLAASDAKLDKASNKAAAQGKAQ